MGQTESTEASHTPSNTENTENTEEGSQSHYYNISNDILKKNFSNLESYSLRSTFENLSSINNGEETIEEEAFIVSIKKMCLIFKSKVHISILPFLNSRNIWGSPMK